MSKTQGILCPDWWRWKEDHGWCTPAFPVSCICRAEHSFWDKPVTCTGTETRGTVLCRWVTGTHGVPSAERGYLVQPDSFIREQFERSQEEMWSFASSATQKRFTYFLQWRLANCKWEVSDFCNSLSLKSFVLSPLSSKVPQMTIKRWAKDLQMSNSFEVSQTWLGVCFSPGLSFVAVTCTITVFHRHFENS